MAPSIFLRLNLVTINEMMNPTRMANNIITKHKSPLVETAIGPRKRPRINHGNGNLEVKSGSKI